MKCTYCFEELMEDGVCRCPKCGHQNGMDVDPLYLHPHTVIGNGRYEIGSVIGAGGFGITYAAFDRTLSTRVAIKEYLPGEFSTRVSGAVKITVYGGEKQEQFEDGLAKFYEESNRLAKFNKVPGIVQIYDVFQQNDTAYIVMEFLEGEDLGTRLKREGKIPAEEMVRIMVPILEALSAVHRSNIIHRDIAPNNIFLCKDGRVKLLDFGAARSATGTYSKSLTVLYKEGYTAEEQYQSRGEQGPWTDVYAAAATMYKAITGVTPDGAMERRRKDKLKEPSRYGIKLETNVERAIMNALVMDRKKRTQSAEDFKNELLGQKRVSKNFKRSNEKRQIRVPRPVLIVAAILFVLIAVLFLLLRTGVIGFDIIGNWGGIGLESGKVRVANVVNMDLAEAEEKLQKEGLLLEIADYKYSNRVIEGRVMSQQEETGQIVDEGTTVHVTVSQGAGSVEVPSLVGKQWEEMQSVMDELCLEYDVTENESIEVPGCILTQDIEAGTTIEQGETVSITISKGMDYDSSQESSAPSLLGMNIDEAKNSLAAMSAYVKVVGYENSDTYPANSVCAQNISEGTVIYGNDIIEVTVSLGVESVSVPNVLDMDRAEAEKVLTDVGLNVAFEEVESIDIEGQVLAQDIVADQIVDKGTVVTLQIAVKEVSESSDVSETVSSEEEQPEQEEQKASETLSEAEEEQTEQVEQVAENVDETNTNSGNVSVKLNSKYTKIAEQLVEDDYIEYFSDYVDAEYAGQLLSEKGLSTGNYMVIAFAKKGHRYYYERGGNSPKSGSSKASDNKKWSDDEISTKVSELSDGEGYKKMGMAYYDNGDAIVVLGR
jgi:beta-lactam-binding protein with PASTA domain